MAPKVEKNEKKPPTTDYLLPLLLVFLSDVIWRVHILVHIDTNF